MLKAKHSSSSRVLALLVVSSVIIAVLCISTSTAAEEVLDKENAPVEITATDLDEDSIPNVGRGKKQQKKKGSDDANTRDHVKAKAEKAERVFNEKTGLNTAEAKARGVEIDKQLGKTIPIKEWNATFYFEQILDLDMFLANETSRLGLMLQDLSEEDDQALSIDGELEKENMQAFELFEMCTEVHAINKKTSEVTGKMWKQYREATSKYTPTFEGTIEAETGRVLRAKTLKFDSEHDEETYFQFLDKTRDVLIKLYQVFDKNRISVEKMTANIPQFVEAAHARILETSAGRQKRHDAAMKAAEKDQKNGVGQVTIDGTKGGAQASGESISGEGEVPQAAAEDKSEQIRNEENGDE